MATKKSAIVLKDAKLNDMVAAGIEVKLTKMEIADYIAEKAKEELDKRQNELRDLICDYTQKGIIVDMNKHQKIAADALKTVIGKDVFVMARYHNWSNGDGTSSYRWTGYFTFKNNEGDDQYSFNCFAPFVLDSNQNPNIDVDALFVEQREGWERIHNLGKKKHRTMLVEQILSGSDSGKKVLADLTNMVQRAVHGDKA